MIKHIYYYAVVHVLHTVKWEYHIYWTVMMLLGSLTHFYTSSEECVLQVPLLNQVK